MSLLDLIGVNLSACSSALRKGAALGLASALLIGCRAATAELDSDGRLVETGEYPSTVTEVNKSHSVVICGHAYSLYVRNKIESREELVYSEEYLNLFAKELREQDPAAVFFLGDSTRYSTEFEWDMLQRVFEPVKAEKIWAAGNHEVRDLKAFQSAGGVRNSSHVIGNNKYIALDAKTVLEAEDLAFLERELEDWENYDNVFLLMHFFLVSAETLDPNQDVDPFEAYTNLSNWNRDVVPLIAGKVKYVFSGDFYPRQTGRVVQRSGDHEIHYIRNSFLFRRGRGNDQTGDGPMVYLALEFDETGEVSVYPKILPVELSDPWYRHYPTGARGSAEEDAETPVGNTSPLNRHSFRNSLSFALNDTWIVQAGPESGDLILTATRASKTSQLQLQMFEYPDLGAVSPEAFHNRLVEGAERNLGKSLEIQERGEHLLRNGLELNWIISQALRGDSQDLNLNGTFVHKGRGYLMVFTSNESSDDYRSQLITLLTIFKAADLFKFGL